MFFAIERPYSKSVMREKRNSRLVFEAMENRYLLAAVVDLPNYKEFNDTGVPTTIGSAGDELSGLAYNPTNGTIVTMNDATDEMFVYNPTTAQSAITVSGFQDL